jgi:hypothetical protein
MQTSRQCRSARLEIDTAEVGTRLAGRVTSHLATCSSCREFSEERTRLRELVGSLAPVSAPGDFDVRLRARLMNERATHGPWFGFLSVRFGTPALAAAAVMVMLVGGFVLWNRGSASTNQPEQVKAVVPPSEPPQPSVAAATESRNESITVAGRKDEVNKGAAMEPKVGKAPRGLTPVQLAKRPSVKSNDFAIEPAPVFRQSPADPNAAEISLSKPFEFSLQDSHGVTHKISLPPVSFGGQFASGPARFQAANYSGNRIW